MRGMRNESGGRGEGHRDDRTRPEPGAPVARNIAAGRGWRVSEMVCGLGPHDRPFEERHEEAGIALVVAGSFQYRSAAGSALLYPGAFLLGNPGACFTCGHEHGTGDRCIAFHFAPALFAEIAATAAGSSRFRFPAAMLPASRGLALPLIESRTRSRGADRLAMEEWAMRLAEKVLGIVAGAAAMTSEPSARDLRRISNVLRHSEEHFDQPLDLAALAEVARMSRYHFLRTFRRALSLTPYQFVLSLRMRQAAERLCTTAAPVSEIAFDAGFGDLSTFNGRFRDMFGMSPGAFRKAQLAA